MSEKAASIVVVGSANVDLIIRSGRLPRPGETVVGGEFVSAGGGKGANQALAARRLGAAVTFIGRVGQDAPGTSILEALSSEGIDRTWLSIDPGAPTGVALILVDRQGQNLISVASGANQCLSPDDVHAAAGAITRADVVVTQLEIPLETVRAALETARRDGRATILNPAPAGSLPDDLLPWVDWLTPNESEATALTGLEVTDSASAIRAARALLERGPRHVVITLGSRGAIMVDDQGIIEVPPFAVTAIDATAAGDAFTAGLAASLGAGRSPIDALTFASAAGSLACTRSGAQPSLPGRASVDALIRQQPNQWAHRAV